MVCMVDRVCDKEKACKPPWTLQAFYLVLMSVPYLLLRSNDAELVGCVDSDASSGTTPVVAGGVRAIEV